MWPEILELEDQDEDTEEHAESAEETKRQREQQRKRTDRDDEEADRPTTRRRTETTSEEQQPKANLWNKIQQSRDKLFIIRYKMPSMGRYKWYIAKAIGNSIAD